MKVIINFFKRDKVQIALVVTFLCAVAIGFVVSFVYIAFPKDPAMEEMYKRAEIREKAEIRAKYIQELQKQDED